MKKTLTSLVVAVFSLTVGVAMADTAPASGQWQQTHPRRAEVNHRLQNQDNRIHADVKDGQLTKQQAGALHKDDRQIRREERRMAARDHGHITKGEQAKLNSQENSVSAQIPKTN